MCAARGSLFSEKTKAEKTIIGEADERSPADVIRPILYYIAQCLTHTTSVWVYVLDRGEG